MTSLRLTIAGGVTALAAAAGLTLGSMGVASASPDASTTPPAFSAATAAENAALDFADDDMGSTAYDGECLQLASDAYGIWGVSLASEASETDSAIDFWNTYTSTEYPPSDAPPAGALVFWGATATNPYGHVAISYGNGQAVSSEERDNVGIHVFNIADRNADGYTEVGYLMPG